MEDSLHGRNTPRPCNYALGLTIKTISTRRVIPLSEFDDGQSQGQQGQIEGDDDDAGAMGDGADGSGVERSLEDVAPPPAGSAKAARMKRKNSKTFTKVTHAHLTHTRTRTRTRTLALTATRTSIHS